MTNRPKLPDRIKAWPWNRQILSGQWHVDGKGETTEYVRADVDALSSDPVVKELLAKERERCAQVARSHLQRVQPHNPDAVGSDLVSQGYGNACLNILCDIEDLK